MMMCVDEVYSFPLLWIGPFALCPAEGHLGGCLMNQCCCEYLGCFPLHVKGSLDYAEMRFLSLGDKISVLLTVPSFFARL